MKYLFSSLLLILLGATGAAAADFQIIVHSDRPETSVSQADLSRIFLKKTTRWEDGSKIQPLDQEKGSSVRTSFLAEVHDRDENGYAKYWVKLVFSGRAQPPEILSDDGAVAQAVEADRAAIGYVSRAASLPDGVKTLRVEP